MGKVNYNPSSQIQSLLTASHFLLEQSIAQVWELEQIPDISTSLSPIEELAESQFQKSVSLANSGYYNVSLPFRQVPFLFEASRDVALEIFLSLERRLVLNPDLYELYWEFMQDYLDSKHIELIPISTLNKSCYYIPYHCMLRPDSCTTKLRVVFSPNNQFLH